VNTGKNNQEEDDDDGESTEFDKRKLYREKAMRLDSQPACSLAYRKEALEFLMLTGVSPVITAQGSLCGNNCHGDAHHLHVVSCADAYDAAVAWTEPMLVRTNIPPAILLPYRYGTAEPNLNSLIVRLGWGLRSQDEYKPIALISNSDLWKSPPVYNGTATPG